MSDPGGQSPAPQNAPPSGQLVPGIQPGLSQGIIVGRFVIVFGATGGVFVYNGTPGPGTLIASMASPQTTTDLFGNTVEPEIAVYGPSGQFIQLAVIGGQPFIRLQANPATENTPAQIYTAIDNPGLAEAAQVNIDGPIIDSFTDHVGIVMVSSAADGSGFAGGNLDYTSRTGVQTSILEWGEGGLFANLPQDGNPYNVTQKTLYANGQTVTSTSFVAVTGLSQPVAAGRYRIHGSIQLECVTADTLLFSFAGPSISSGSVEWITYPVENSNTAAAQQWTFRQVNTLAGARTPAMTAGQLWTQTFEGEYIFSAAGTFTLQVATLAGNNIGVLTQSRLDIALQVV
jgi:hypothetical protein